MRIVVFIFTVFAFIMGCSESEAPTLVENNNEIEQKIGFYHNEAVDLYLKKDADLKKRASDAGYNAMREQIILALSEVHPNVFDKEEVQIQLQASNTMLDELGLFSEITNGNYKRTSDVFVSKFPELVKYIAEKRNISSELQTELLAINSMVQNFDDSESILEKVNALESKQWNTNDLEIVSAFVQVYNSSFDYWKTTEQNASEKTMADGDGVILADAAGAAYGLLLGPIGSIVEGALFSLIANNQ